MLIWQVHGQELFNTLQGIFHNFFKLFARHNNKIIYRYGQQIESGCATLLAIEANSDIEAYATWVFNRWRLSNESCYDNQWESFIYWYGGTEWDSYAAQNSMRQWLYQTCAEYGWYQSSGENFFLTKCATQIFFSSGSDDILFGSMFPVELSLQFCEDLYDNL